jgi:DNA-binding CsgD family transcriptional regulator
MASRLGDRALAAEAMNAVGTAQWFGDPDQAEPMLLRGLELARTVGDDDAVAALLVNLGSGAGEIRRYAVARRWLRAAIDWCTARDLDRSGKYATAWLARCLFEQGDWSDATTLLPSADHAASAPTRIVALTTMGRLRARRGDPGAAEALAEAWALAERTGDLQRMWPVAAGLAELGWLTGQEPSNSILVRNTYDLAVRLGHGWAIGELGQWLAADGLADASLPAPYRLATASPNDAAREWDAIGCPYEAALALSRSEDPKHLTAALAKLERLGARPAADLVSRRMRNLGIRPARRSTLAHPLGLTARETDVFELLRDHLNNAEIAERLHISEKTVDHHVSAILGKLGARSRREAARRQDGEAANPT